MIPSVGHKWNLSVPEAVRVQKELAGRIRVDKLKIDNIRYIAGIDCAPSSDMSKYFAAAVIWDIQSRQMLEYHIAHAPLTFPYVPGLLSFREIPAIIEVMKKINQMPDILMVDGHGIAHPRSMGIAAHVGLIFDLPAFGCGKSLLYGKYTEPALERGSFSPLIAKDKIIGNVIRTRSNVKPVFVSIGHKADLETITELTISCSGRFRLPEPTHLADKLVAQKEDKSVVINVANLF
ncbi:MAG: nfi [Burkholderiales bacterium]|jgi:deoxyribonuclease V|nr:nfi [Burkholderiales bacterium]